VEDTDLKLTEHIASLMAAKEHFRELAPYAAIDAECFHEMCFRLETAQTKLEWYQLHLHAPDTVL
jgi:hypothetical protein